MHRLRPRTWPIIGGTGGHYGAGRLGRESTRGRGYHPAMAKLLLNLRNVPDDEADEVRDLLDSHDIAWYETKPSLWGVSAGGIWAANPTQEQEAISRVAQYQAERSARHRAQREVDLREGRVPSTWDNMRANPRQALVAVVGIALMLGLATLPFLLFAG